MLSRSSTLKSLKGLFILIWVIKALESLYLFSHGDALSYHIVWPKIVASVGFQGMLRDFFPVWLAGYFDLIYGLPFLLFKTSIYTQSLSQFLHYFFSLGLSSWLITRYHNNRMAAYLGAITLLTINKSSDFFLYAKNDGFIALLALTLFFLIDKQKVQKLSFRSVATFSLLFGIGLGTKLSALFVFLPLGLYLLIKIRKVDLKSIFLIALLTITVSAPVFYLKWLYLKSPFFPAFLSLFPGSFSPEAIAQWKAFTSEPITLKALFMNAKEFFSFKVVFLTALPFFFLKKEIRKEANIQIPLFLGIVSFVLYLLMNGGVVASRFYFGSIFLLVISFTRLLLAHEKTLEQKKSWLFIILILILLDSKVDKSINRIVKYSKDFVTMEQKDLISKYIPRSRVWEKFKNLEAKNLDIYTINFAQSYYAPSSIRLRDKTHLNIPSVSAENCHPYLFYISPDKNFSLCPLSKLEKVFSWEGMSLYRRKSLK